jgi:hypothetical protein
MLAPSAVPNAIFIAAGQCERRFSIVVSIRSVYAFTV